MIGARSERIFRSLWTDRGIAVTLTVLALGVYLVCIVGQRTTFDYFGRLANAMWSGHVWLDGAPLNELDRGRDGLAYSVLPPLPALLLLPLVPFGPSAQIETFMSAVVGALIAFPQYLGLRALGVPRRVAVWCGVFALFGTTAWFTSIDGRSWFFANVSGLLFATVAVWLAAARRSPLLVGLALGLAALARTPIIVAAPGLLLLARGGTFAGLTRTEVARTVALFLLGVAPAAFFQAWYDWVRWGDVFSIYGPLTHVGAANEIIARGRFRAEYVLRHINALFFLGPAFVDSDLFFLRPRTLGMAILLGSPAYLWLLRAASVLWSAPAWRAFALSAAPVAVAIVFNQNYGVEQYGYRYSLDYQAFLIPLLAVGAAWTPTGWRPVPGLFRVAVIASIALTGYFLVALKLYGFSR